MQILLDLQKKMELIEACLFFYFNYIFSGNGDSFVPFLTFGVYFLSYPIYILFFIIIIYTPLQLIACGTPTFAIE